MNGSYLKLVIDDVTRDVFPSSKLREKPNYLRLARLQGCALFSASREELNAFLTRSLSAPGGPIARQKNPQRISRDGA